jgi:hypothetical protein
MRNVIGAAIVLGARKLAFSTAMLVIGKYQFGAQPNDAANVCLRQLLFGSGFQLTQEKICENRIKKNRPLRRQPI